MTNRRTSVYTVDVHCDSIRDAVFTANALAVRLPDLVGVGTDIHRAYGRFRTTDDVAALDTARRIVPLATELPFVLHTGVGVHKREVAQDALASLRNHMEMRHDFTFDGPGGPSWDLETLQRIHDEDHARPGFAHTHYLDPPQEVEQP